MFMKRTFTASVWREGSWYVSQCLEVDVASQGESLRTPASHTIPGATRDRGWGWGGL